MANPYEETLQSNGVEIPDLELGEINLEDSTENLEAVPEDTEIALRPTRTESIEETPPEPTTTPVEMGGSTGYFNPELPKRSDRVNYFKGLKEARKLPHGDPGKDAWAMENHGVTWEAYEAKKAEQLEQARNPHNFLKQKSILYNNEAMMSGAVGALDFVTDLGNLGLKKLTGKNRLPKIPEFEDKGAQAFREISSLIVPFYFLKGKAIGGAGAIHKSGVAAPWLVRLGNNPVFARFAKMGLDLGVGAGVDLVAETNKTNDTLATSWKRGQWVGHNFIPEAWTSDGLGPDDKAKANALEGVKLGFYTDVAAGMVKLLRAGKSTSNVTKYLSEANNQKKLNEIVIDPLDSKTYTDSNGIPASPIEEALRRSDEKYQRDLDGLTKYLSKDELPTKPTVGIHAIQDELQTGIVTKDKDGILGIARQQAQIATNKGTTQGALGTALTESFRKLGTVPDEVAKRTLLKDLRKTIEDAGPYKVELPNGQKLSWQEIDREGIILAEVLSDPTLPRGELVKILDNFKSSINNFKTVNPVAYKGLAKASIKLLDDWANINTHKAQAYLIGSEASGISGVAEGARYMDGTTATGRANELLLDRLELFEIETSISDFNWKGRNHLLDTLAGNPKDVDKKIKGLRKNFDQKLTDIIPKAKRFRETLQSVQENSPEFATAIRLAYEMSEGNIQSIKSINRYIQNQFGTYSKAIFDSAPEIPSMFNKGLMTNVFNSMLSAIGTPTKAMFGNFGGLIAEPAHVFYGALRTGDVQQLRRGAWMYFGYTDTLQKGFRYMGTIFRKASQTPDELGTLFRADIKAEKIKNLAFAEEVAAAAAKNGEHGPEVVLSLSKELDAIGADPTLRFGPNLMTALDGFTEATQKVAQDRGMAFDFLEAKYPNGKWGAKEFNEAYEDFWKKGWTDEGTISQSAVEYSRREIALNLDSPLTKRLNPVIKRFPLLRSIFWFPNTQMNALEIFGKYGNTSRVKIGTDFAGEYAELLGPMGRRNISDFDTSEIEAILAKRGIDMSGDYMSKFVHLRNKIRGRVATGNVAVMGAALLYTQDRIRGNGHWDRKIQKVRDSQGYARKTYKGLDGNWHSYEWMGPVGDWLALSVDFLDNFDSISTSTFERMEKKMGFILGASLTNKSLLGDLEPLFHIISGNETAIARWKGTMTNAMFPLAGFRNEIGKLMNGMLREVENGDIDDMIRNRNNWLDIMDPEGALPNVTDWVTGKPINKHGGSFWHRLKNTYTPLKSYEAPTEEGQFLIDMEYDAQPSFSTSPGGIPYSPAEKAELANLVGEDKTFNRELKSIIRSANSLTYTTDQGKTLKGYVDILSHLRKQGYTSEDLPDYSNIRNMLDLAVSRAIRRVENRISTATEIKAKEIQKRQKIQYSKSENIDALDRILQLNNSN